MTRVELFSLAGLSYQPSLTVPQQNVLQCKNEEQLRSMAGMYLFDSNYALVFGNSRVAIATQQYYKENILPKLGVSKKIEPTPANPMLTKKLLENPNNPGLRAQFIQQVTRNMMLTAEAAADPVVMDFIVDAFWGSLVEGLYVSCSLARTEEASQEMVDLFLGQLERFQLFNELIKQFEEDENLKMIEFAERNGLLQTVISRIEETKGRLSKADIEMLLAKVTPFRTALVSICK